MTDVDVLLQRNHAFVEDGFDASLSINPSGRMMVIGCVDPRVDPSRVLGLAHGEAGIIRNVGGRITPATLKTMAMLSRVGKANGGSPGAGWNLVILHHTDCGMTDLAAYPELLAEYFEISPADLDQKSVSDPFGSVRVDVDIVRNIPLIANQFRIYGLVYDVATGLVETVVAPSAD